MASLLNNASLLLNPAGSTIAYKEDKINSVLPNNGAGDFAFTGGNGGTRVNQQGYIERTPHNLLINSNGSSFSLIRGTRGLAATRYNIDGYLYSFTSGNPNINNNTFNPAGVSNTYTFSFYIDSTGVSAGSVELNFSANGAAGLGLTSTFTYSTGTWGAITENTTYVEAGSSSVGQEYIGNGVWRLWGTMTIKPSVVSTLFPIIYYNTNTNIWVGGVQLNVGYVRPYQPTTDRLNYPRITYQNGRGALLSEPQRTNLFLQSQAFTTYNLFRLTLTQNAGISPDGTSNAVKWVDTATTGQHQLEPFFTAVSGQTYTVSVFVKAAERTQFHIFAFADNGVFNSTDAFYDVAAGTVISGTGASIEKWPNGWYRCIRTMTAGASGTGYWGVGPAVNGAASYVGDTNSGILVWGGQNEAGSFPTSYIPTTSATVTRVADVSYVNGISSIIGQTQGVLYAQVTPSQLVDGSYICISDNATTTNRLIFGFESGNQALRWYTPYGNSLGGTVIVGQQCKIAAAYNVNDFSIYLNGIQVGSYSSGQLSGTYSHLGLDSYVATSQTFRGTVNNVALFNTRLTNTQLAELTTVRSGSGGNISYYGPYTIHTFTGSATFTPSFNGEVEVLVVAGGGSGGGSTAGGGGAGGAVYVSAFGVSQGTGITVTVGAGGAQANQQTAGNDGSNSSFGGLVAVGGGGGGFTASGGSGAIGRNGGSGGGGAHYGGANFGTPGNGILGQGNNGGNGSTGDTGNFPGGGGGGAGAVGGNAISTKSGNGGAGLPYSISGFSTYYAGGGGGGSQTNGGDGGIGGGGAGTSNGRLGTPATANTGGGGGGGWLYSGGRGGAGGSGIVIVRYLT
jgi:hypothetical protein